MALVRSTLGADAKPPERLLEEVKAAAKKPAAFDEDCPPTTAAEFAVIDEILARRKADREKKNISLRVSARMIDETRARVGKGYTGFLSRLLEAALNEPELIKKCL